MDNNIRRGYVCDETSKDGLKYIATAIEAMIAAIYLESNNYNTIKDIINTWILLIEKQSE